MMSAIKNSSTISSGNAANDLFILVFAALGGLKKYSLFPNGEISLLSAEAEFSLQRNLSQGKAVFEITEVLVVPANEGLPFQIELPFQDVEKVRKVLPQMVGEVFAHVNSGWRFSWFSTAQGEGFLIAGLAFPPESLRPRGDSLGPWRLIVPDVFLIRPEKEFNGVFYEAPGSSGMVQFDRNGVYQRCIPSGRGLPVDAIARNSTIDRSASYELISHGKEIYELLTEMLTNPGGRDLSGWAEFQSKNLVKTLIKTVSGIAVSFVVLFHIFLYIECRLLETRRTRLIQHLATEFETTFPGQRAVEPIGQTRALLRTLETRSLKKFRVPSIPWVAWASILNNALAGKVKIKSIFSDPSGWQITGDAPGYAIIEEKSRFLSSFPLVTKVRITDSQPINLPSEKQIKIRFRIEGQWAN